MDSESPTSVIGEDGKFTIAIVVDYAWHPTLEDESKLREILLKHGWIGEESGAWFQTLDSIDSISVDKASVSALIEIWSLPEVVVVEMQNVLAPSNDIAKAGRVQQKFTPTMHIAKVTPGRYSNCSFRYRRG